MTTASDFAGQVYSLKRKKTVGMGEVPSNRLSRSRDASAHATKKHRSCLLSEAKGLAKVSLSQRTFEKGLPCSWDSPEPAVKLLFSGKYIDCCASLRNCYSKFDKVAAFNQ